MQLRTLGTFAAGLGLWLGSPSAAEPAKLPIAEKAKGGDKAVNQKLADAVMGRLSASEAAADADLEIKATGGTVTVTGTVGNDAQKVAVLQVVRRVEGVTLVKDGVQVKSAAPKSTVSKGILQGIVPAAFTSKAEPVAGKADPVAAKPASQGILQAAFTSKPKPESEPTAAKPAPQGILQAAATSKPEPVAAQPTANQKLADAVVAKLSASDAAAHADLDVFATNGEVSVMGTVASESDRTAIMEIVSRVEGVTLVKDGLQVKAVAAAPKAAPKEFMPMPKAAPHQVAAAAKPAPQESVVVPPPAPQDTVVTQASAAPAKLPERVAASTPEVPDGRTPDERLAETVVTRIASSDASSNTDLRIQAAGGEVTVDGTLATEMQRAAILRTVQAVAGVKLVVDGMEVKAAAAAAVEIPAIPTVSPVAFEPTVAAPAAPAVAAREPARMPLPPMAEPAPRPAKAEPVKPAEKRYDEKAANQRLADAVYAELMTSDTVANTDLDVFANGGAVTISGRVGSERQKTAILEVVRRVEGVTKVRDGVRVKPMATAAKATPQGVVPAQAVGPYATPVPSAVPPARVAVDPQVAEPYPVGPGGGLDGAAPPLPPNAWPTYAPYNNVSRVAYPTAYPYNAFPFIGPYYPFPKVPLGWRKVTLEWEDGHWWLGRKQAPIDYWRVKFGY